MHRIVRRLTTRFEPTETERLRAELASYRTEADRADLYAVLEHYPSADTERIRDILAHHAAMAA